MLPQFPAPHPRWHRPLLTPRSTSGFLLFLSSRLANILKFISNDIYSMISMISIPSLSYTLFHSFSSFDYVFLCGQIFEETRVAEVARAHGRHSPKSLDSDENCKPEHTLFCRELRFVAIYALFGDLLAKKSAFLGQKQCFLSKKCPMTWYILHISLS